MIKKMIKNIIKEIITSKMKILLNLFFLRRQRSNLYILISIFFVFKNFFNSGISISL